jgi:hypothetical protein
VSFAICASRSRAVASGGDRVTNRITLVPTYRVTRHSGGRPSHLSDRDFDFDRAPQ